MRPRGTTARLAAAVVLLAAALPWSGAGGQQTGAPTTTILSTSEDGRTLVGVPIGGRGFRLFAEADAAISGMRMTGGYGWQFPNVSGPCPYYFTNNTEVCGLTQNQARTGFITPFFDIGFVAGVPISDFRKIRAVYPGVNNMQAPLGYATPYRFTLAPPRNFRWGPADGQFGSFFSGVTSTSDGSCRDHTSPLSGRVPAGLTLTAGLDCPATWANGVFAGQQMITGETYLARAQASPATFRFDNFRVPREQRAGFLGDFATYGAFSDHYREQLQRYGGVTPRGAGASSERGFPIGIEVRYDAWQYSRPSIRNVVYYQMTIINNSARVYGSGVDYDSLYLGILPGFLFNGANAQGASMYFDVQRNTVIAVGGGTSGNCSATYPLRNNASPDGCLGFPNALRRFVDGAQAFIFLKSPLGDTRNKLFTRAGSPFAAIAGIPENIKDDTITYNHARATRFGGSYNNSVARNDRALFGYISSIEELFYDGRTPADFQTAPGLVETQRYFMGTEFRNFTGSLDQSFLRFPRFVPGSTNQPNTPRHPRPGQRYGSWDYNNDGVQDTIFVGGCGPNGCHDPYSDTLANGLMSRFGNVGNVISMGPVRLRAGDSTQILLAMAGSSDSLQFEASINAAIETYLNFDAGPAAITPPALTSADVEVTPAEVRARNEGVSTALVRLRIPQLVSSADPFLARIATQIATSNDATVARLRRLNPNLVAQVEARARNNLAEIQVYKSCDRGATFTVESFNPNTGAGCTPAPSIGPTGAAIGFGFRPFRTIAVDTLNQPATSFITDVVQAGRTYLYTFVTRTRGLIDIPIVDSVAPGVTRPTNLSAALNLDADTIVSALARSGPATVVVYAPITLPAGTRAATLDTATVSGLSTTLVTATPAGGSVAAGEYRLFFANRFIVRSTVNAAGVTTNTTVDAQRVIAGTQNGTTRDSVFVADQRTFTAAGAIFADDPTLLRRNLFSTDAQGVRTFVDTLRAAPGAVGYIIVRTGGTEPRALYISRSATGTSTAFETQPFFPGFRLTFEASTGSVNVPREQIVLRSPTDTINRAVVLNNGVIALAATGTASQSLNYSLGGTYRLEWSDDSFGPGAPFLYNAAQSLQEQVSTSLAARRNVSQTVVTDSIRNLIIARTLQDTVGAGSAAAQAARLVNTNRPLQVFQLPFRLLGSNGQPAQVAMFRRFATGPNAASDSIRNNSRLLGNLGDTVRVSVPSNLWLPGDTLYVIEQVLRDSTVTIGGSVTAVVRDTTIGGQTVRAPIQVARTIVGARLVLGCTGGNATVPATSASPRCNPLVPGTFAATGYLPYRDDWTLAIVYPRAFDLFSEVRLNAAPASAVGVQLVAQDLNDIRVVPNPYVVQGSFDDIQGGARVGTPRVLFTGVPLSGVVRIYSVSGQLIQQITWTEADLLNRGNGTPNGDLPFTLRTREGLDLGSGLYVFVLQSTGTGPTLTKRGKFVVIR